MADRFESFVLLLGVDVSVRWLITLLHFLWQGAVIGGGVAIVGRLLRDASPRFRYALYSAALVSLPVCVAVTFCLVDVPASLQSSSPLQSPGDASAESSTLPAPTPAVVGTEAAPPVDAAAPSEHGAGNVATMAVVGEDRSESLSHLSLAVLSRAAPWFVLAYVVGVACFLLRLSSALQGSHRLRSHAVKVTDAKLLELVAHQADRVKLKCVPVVAYCRRVVVPTVVGVLRPMILLPVPLITALAPDEFAAIIRHELAHIRRYDLWMNLLQRVIESVLFFHPVVWFLSRRLSAEREVCCDDLVISSGYEPRDYAGTLLRMAELCAISRQSAGLSLATTGEKAPLLERRIQRLINWGNTPRLKLTRAGMAALLLTLASLILVPSMAHIWAQAQVEKVAPAPASERKPKHKDGQALFQKWQANARTDGKIPGALIGRLGEKVRYFISLNKGHDLAVKFEQLLSRFDASRDWTQADTVALLDDVSDIHRIPLRSTLEAAEERTVLAGQPLPADVAGAVWGRPAPNGLRVAWLLEPVANAYPLGTSLKSRILVHNSGKEPVIFIMPSWQQSGKHSAHDARGATVKVSATEWTTQARRMTYRLAPGEYCESPAPGIGVGADTGDEDWANVRVGAWIEAKKGDDVRFSPGAVEVRCSPSVVGTRRADGRPLNTDPKDLWGRIIAERVGRELPLPAARAERLQIIRRVTRDLFGDAPTPEEIAAFAADDALTAQAALKKRLQERPGIAPFTGALPPGDLRFRVLAADPDVAKRPCVANGPGRYNLGGNVRVIIVRKRDGKRYVNEGKIKFFSPDPEAEPPGKPHEIKLADGFLTWAIAWERGSTVLWVAEKGVLCSYDFTNPADVKEMRFDAGRIAEVPEQVRGALSDVFDMSGAPVKQPEDGAKLAPGTEEKLQWGKSVNGLRAALIRPPALGVPETGERIDLHLVVQNVSTRSIRLITDSAAPKPCRLFVRKGGVTLFGLWSKEPTEADFMLEPREVAIIRLLPEHTAGRSIAADPDLTFSAEMTVENAPAGAWNGRLVPAEMKASFAGHGLLPRHEDARTLFKVWNAGMRWNGKIPGALVGLLADHVRTYAKNNPTRETTPQLLKILPRLDATRDWSGHEALTLLDELATAQATPIRMVLSEEVERIIQKGAPLPPDLANAPWGEVQPNGLRMAWLLEPRAAEYRLGTRLRSRILFHNSGKEAVVFRTRTWHQSNEHKARDAKGADINVLSARWTTIGRLVPFRLAPGEYVEVTGAGIGVGADKDAGDWHGWRIGSWVEAKARDEVTFTPDLVVVGDPMENPPASGESRWWLAFITVRLNREKPLPMDAEVRRRLLYSVAMDLFGTPVSSKYAETFLADRDPNAFDSLAKRLAQRPGLTPFSGSLQSGPTRFRVLPADPDAATRPRVATGPGRYTLGDLVRLDIERKLDGKRYVNEADIRFFSHDPKDEPPGKPHRIKLPDGLQTWAIAWERDATVLWVAQKGSLRTCDFTNPALVKETRIERAAFSNVPEPLREALRAASEGGSNASPPPAATLLPNSN